MRNAALQSICSTGQGSYAVTVLSMKGESLVFTFRVDDHDIQIVTWSKEFVDYMEHNLSPAQPVFEAILAFHRAQSAQLP
jgi:hypothetical protein